MTPEEFQIESLRGTFLYGAVALIALLVAAVWSGSPAAVTFALLACGLAYGSQFMATLCEETAALTLGVVCWLAWVAGGVAIVFGWGV